MVARRGSNTDPYLGWGMMLAGVLFVLYVYPGILSPVTARFDGTCRVIETAASAEDVRIDPTTGVAYLTYYDVLRPQPGGKRESGTVMLADLNAVEPRVRAALNSAPPEFYPAALSLFTPPSGPKRMFVVSWSSPGQHSIEIFEQSATGAFNPVESIKDPLLWSPSGVLAVGPRQFYVTNDHGYREKDAVTVERRREAKLRTNRGTILYYDGTRMRIVASRLDRASSLALSPDGRTVYVSESDARQVDVFDRDLATGELTKREELKVDGVPHNLTTDEKGNVWVAAHPRALQFMRTVRDPADRSPTQVLKITPGAKEGHEITAVYVNEGEQISAGSVASARGNQLVIGSVADHRLLVCTQGKPLITGPEKDT
jgi:arylesterase/paraoxonase